MIFAAWSRTNLYFYTEVFEDVPTGRREPVTWPSLPLDVAPSGLFLCYRAMKCMYCHRDCSTTTTAAATTTDTNNNNNRPQLRQHSECRG